MIAAPSSAVWVPVRPLRSVLFAPVIRVVVMLPGCVVRTPAGSGPVVVGLPGPPQPAPGRADWMGGAVGVRPGRTPLARPPRPRDGGRAGRWPPARGRAAPRGARRAGRHFGGLPDPAGAGSRDLTVAAGRGGSRPGAAAARRRARAAVPARRPGRAGARYRPGPHHAGRAAPARPAGPHPGGGV